jgi:hypothetical protein
MNLIDNMGNAKMPSTLKDPFNKTSVRDISVWVRDAWGNGKFTAHGSVEFKNGETEGKQKFTGATFDEVVLKIKMFLSDLNVS